jgi:hypothetical protein
MLSTKPVGRGAQAQKYDLLTALGTFALAQGKHEQRRVLRLMTLITARYNWARDELSVGQREIARMWSVDERTVKREMAHLRAKGWLVVRRQGARGRVTQYSMDLAKMFADTSAHWGAVGPDFELRMSEKDAPAETTVVPLPVRGTVTAPDLSSGTEWALAQGELHAQDAGLYASWISALVREDRAGGRITLRAPSRFHAAYVQSHLEARLLRTCQEIDATVSELRISF